MSKTKARTPKNLPVDKAALRALVQSAVDVELFTIPLYMTALYSIQGTYPAPTSGADLWPGMRPDPTATDVNQLAYNAIFSVYIQEMFHLQLAGNLASAMGEPPKLQPPTYDGTSIPCIGNLQDVPGYEDVEVKLGPLDKNQIKLFLAIEEPDYVSTTEKPAVPFAGWSRGDELPEFGTIGHLYECIQEYMDLEYQDGKKTFTLWDRIYDPDSIQIDLFNYVNSKEYHPAAEYPDLDLFFPPGLGNKKGRAKARKIADQMIDAIIEQGEGRDLKVDPGTVESEFVPSEEAMSADYGANDGAVRHFWDQEGHYERFQQVARWLGDIKTWPQWWAERGGVVAWTWEDLVVAPDLADTKTRKFAEQRATALNDPTTASQVNNALDQSYSSILVAIENSWTDPGWRQRKPVKNPNKPKGQKTEWTVNATQLFPYAAMQALFTRVATVWAANGIPEFKGVSTSGGLPEPGQPAHACQGLDPKNPGKNTCANAVIHTCGASNSCKHQGGCGYPDPAHNGYPSVNDCATYGGCGAPIPVAQVFNPGSTAPWSYDGVTFDVGDNVWATAWKIFKKNNSKAKKPTTPTNLRLVLPPS